MGAKLFTQGDRRRRRSKAEEVRELFWGSTRALRARRLRDVIASLEEEDEDDGDVEAPSMKWADALVLRELEKGDPLLNAHDASHIPAACLAAARRNITRRRRLERLLG